MIVRCDAERRAATAASRVRPRRPARPGGRSPVAPKSPSGWKWRPATWARAPGHPAPGPWDLRPRLAPRRSSRTLLPGRRRRLRSPAVRWRRAPGRWTGRPLRLSAICGPPPGAPGSAPAIPASAQSASERAVASAGRRPARQAALRGGQRLGRKGCRPMASRATVCLAYPAGRHPTHRRPHGRSRFGRIGCGLRFPTRIRRAARAVALGNRGGLLPIRFQMEAGWTF